MKTILAASLLLIANVSQADVIKCMFTEPFVDSVYSMTQSTLTYTGLGIEKTVVKNVSFQIKGAGSFELVAKDGTVLQVLTLNNDGSDGMSDVVYPFQVKDNNEIVAANAGHGGCTSNSLKSFEPKLD